MGVVELLFKARPTARQDQAAAAPSGATVDALRFRLTQTWTDVLGDASEYQNPALGVADAYRTAVQTLCAQFDMDTLPGSRVTGGSRNYHVEWIGFLLQERSSERMLAALQLTFELIDRRTRDFAFLHHQNADAQADRAIAQLNAFCAQHLGSQYADGKFERQNAA